MKKSELKQLIKEEIKSLLKEDFYRGQTPQTPISEPVNDEDEAYDYATQIMQGFSPEEISEEAFNDARIAIQDQYFDGQIKTTQDIEEIIKWWVQTGKINNLFGGY